MCVMLRRKFERKVAPTWKRGGRERVASNFAAVVTMTNRQVPPNKRASAGWQGSWEGRSGSQI